MTQCLNIRLQLVLEAHNNYENLISEAVRGGVTCVQWRDKNLGDREFLKKAFEIKDICLKNKVDFIINDRVDIALLINPDGVHLGQSDLDFKNTRKLLPKNIKIGLSAESFENIYEAENFDLDYLVISPVLSTETKLDITKPFGLEGLKKARKLSRHRLVAIGGVNSQNADLIIKAGADGLAVVTAITRSKNYRQAAIDLLPPFFKGGRGDFYA